MVSTPMRVNATGLLLFRVRARNERDAAENFVSALIDRDEFLELYEAATKQPYSFLYVKLNAKTLNDTFYIRFEKRVTFEDEEDLTINNDFAFNEFIQNKFRGC